MFKVPSSRFGLWGLKQNLSSNCFSTHLLAALTSTVLEKQHGGDEGLSGFNLF